MEPRNEEETNSLSSVSEETSSVGDTENAEMTLSRGESVIEDRKQTAEKKKKKPRSWLTKKLPFFVQTLIFTLAYTELSKFFLRLLNKYIFKSKIKFEWNIYQFIHVVT